MQQVVLEITIRQSLRSPYKRIVKNGLWNPWHLEREGSQNVEPGDRSERFIEPLGVRQEWFAKRPVRGRGRHVTARHTLATIYVLVLKIPRPRDLLHTVRDNP